MKKRLKIQINSTRNDTLEELFTVAKHCLQDPHILSASFIIYESVNITVHKNSTLEGIKERYAPQIQFATQEWSTVGKF